jgi:hypothetical protein
MTNLHCKENVVQQVMHQHWVGLDCNDVRFGVQQLADHNSALESLLDIQVR